MLKRLNSFKNIFGLTLPEATLLMKLLSDMFVLYLYCLFSYLSSFRLAKLRF